MTEQAPILDLRQIRITTLRPEHDLSRFCCGEASIDRYICKRATKYHEAYRDKIFCATRKDSNTVLGVYGLAIKAHDKDTLTEEEKATVTGPYFSAVYLGSLGVLRHYQSNKLGTLLLIDALKRAYQISQNAALLAVVLTSINERTTEFYERHGFGKRDNKSNPTMILPILSLIDIFEHLPSGQLPR